MNRIIDVTINGILFHVEESGVKKLEDYLEAMKEHFSHEEGGEEILSDIEASIADHFSDHMKKRKNVIMRKDVEELIAKMGNVEDFEEYEDKKGKHHKKAEKQEVQEAGGKKKLYRDSDNMMVSGVCSGLAAYFGIDTTLIRVIFFVSIFFTGGFTILLYIILWIVMPLAISVPEKMEMRGEPLTIANIEEKAKDYAVAPKRRSRFWRFVGVVFAIIFIMFLLGGTLLSFFFPWYITTEVMPMPGMF